MRKKLMVVAIAAAVVMGCFSIASAEAKDKKAKSLYSRLGGRKAITAVVDEFVNNCAADTRINRFFADTAKDPKRLRKFKKNLVDQICQASGGPCKYTGKDMKSAHKGMGITDADFNALRDFDVTVVVAGLTYKDEGEFIPTAQQEAEGGELARGGDRAELALPARERELILRAARASTKTVVVLEGGSAILVDEWIDAVDALLMVWYPGREGGHAIANVLFGVVNPSGRLPVSFPRSMDQLMPWDVASLSVQHDLLHGYRYLDHHGHQPSFPFGFGLGYTTFALSNFDVRRAGPLFRITVRVENTGSRAGAAVVQLYVGCEGSRVLRAKNELKGFGRVELDAGEAAVVQIDVADDDLRYFDDAIGDWLLEACTYRLSAGFSSRDLPLVTRWRFTGAEWSA